MAWKVIDYMNGHDGNERFPARNPTVYGPLPVKVWVRDGTRSRVKHRATNGAAKVGSTKDYTAERASLYAAWLAQRDGLVIPKDAKAFPVWSSVTVPGKKAPEPRVLAVEYRQHHQSYRSNTLGPVLLTIAIPHWDWVPQVTEETEDAITALANSLTSDQYIRLLNDVHPVSAEYHAMTTDEIMAALDLTDAGAKYAGID